MTSPISAIAIMPSFPTSGVGADMSVGTTTNTSATPGAGTDFESALKDSLNSGGMPTVSGGSVARSLEPTNTNGNNVNLDSETVIATETGLRYQLALNALDGKYSLLRTALQAS